MERSRKSNLLSGYLIGSLVVAIAGCLLVRTTGVGEGLQNLSYDLPFRFLGDRRVPEILIIWLDRKAQSKLTEPGGRRWHAELLQRLTRGGARLVFYDIIFSTEQPEADPLFAQAIRENGRVILGGTYLTEKEAVGQAPTRILGALYQPVTELRTAAHGWGLAQLDYVDHNFVARRIFTGDSNYDAAVWIAARLVDADAFGSSQGKFSERWFNYYGRSRQAFDQISFDGALDPAGVPPNAFSNKFIFLGGRPQNLQERAEPDLFGTPYTRFGGGFFPGVEMMATEFANLVRHDWLSRISENNQLIFVALWGVAMVVGLLRLPPWHAAWVALTAMAALALLSIHLQIHQRLWWSWLVPVAVQTPMALIWSVGFQYAVESRKTRKLRKAFAAYLSPEMAEQISRSDVDIGLGGSEVEATILFTDLEGFSTLTETLPPAEVSRILIAYFERATDPILANHGMISKYIGDAVMAIWGAPLARPDHAERAVRAACGIIAACQAEFEGRRLRTRIGINTGLTLAGNLGSQFRFDYTAIGATTNLASRLESANQFLGTHILISDATRQKLSGRFCLRRLGRFIVKGIRQPVLIHEVLGEGSFPEAAEWLSSFGKAVDLFEARQLEQAQALFEKVLELREGRDGPSRFYLAHISTLRSTAALSAGWDEVIKLDA